MWQDFCGNKFEDKDALYEDVMLAMDVDDYVEFGHFDIQELLSIIFQKGICDYRLEAKLEEARDNYIDFYYDEIEDESEEE